MGDNEDVKKLLKSLQKQGFTYARTKKNHISVYHPKGHWVATFSGTPSDYRAIANFKAALRRGGFNDT